jgi:lambda family phage tail tape measure protein
LQKAARHNEVERVKRDDQVAQKNVEIKVAESKITEQLIALDFQRADLAKTLATDRGRGGGEDAGPRGQTSSAEAKTSLDRDVETYRQTLAKIGKLTADQQAKAVNEFKVTLTLDIDAKANKEKIDQLFGDIDRKRTELDENVSLGLQSQASAQQELAGFEKARLPVMQSLADEATRLAAALGDPAMIAAAADLQVKLKGLGQVATESSRLTAELGTDIKDSLEGDLSNFLGSTISQVDSLGDAFKSLAISVVASIQQIIAKLLAAKAVEGIARVLGIGAAFASSAALPLVDAAGGSAIAGFGFAHGGWTGPGSKYQPAGIVHADEYVFPKEAVRRLGIARLDALAGLRTPNIVRPRRGYADGGLAAAAVSAQGGTITGVIHVEHDEGVIVKAAAAYIESPTGQKQQLRVMRRRKGAVRDILG